MKPMLLWGFIMLPFLGFSQVVDSVKVANEVDSLVQVCRALAGQGKYEEALIVIEAAKKKAVETFGVESVGYANCLHNQGRINYFESKYTNAEILWLETKAIREKLLGKNHVDYASTLNNLGLVYEKNGKLDQAIQMHLEAKIIREKTLGKAHRDYLQSLNILAGLYKRLSSYEEAEQLYLESKAIEEKVAGKNHPDYTWTLGNLSNLYLILGNFEKAEPLYIETLIMLEKTIGKEHPDYATVLNNMAILYREMGDYKNAESYILEAKSIREKTLGKENPDFCGSLIDLGGLYIITGKFEEAELLFLEAKSIFEDKLLDRQHPFYTNCLNNLAGTYLYMGNYEKSESLFYEVKAIREMIYGKEHPDYAENLNNLSLLYLYKGNYSKAEAFLLESKSIIENTLGRGHRYAENINNLALLYDKIKLFDKSEPLFKELASFDQAQLTSSSTFLSEHELANYINTFLDHSYNLDVCLFTRLHQGENEGVLPNLAFNQALFYKGFLLSTSVHLNTLSSTSPESQELNLRLKSYRRRLATEYAKPITERKGVIELEEMANSTEKELARSVAGYADAIRQVSWQEVQSALKKGEAAIEFIHFRINSPKPTDSIMYAALLLKPFPAGDPSKDGAAASPQFIPLFEERQLTALLKGASGKSYSRFNALYGPESQPDNRKNLYDLVWKPIEAQLAGVQTVYCAPSGLLHKINLGAIRLGSGKETFSDQYQLITLNSTRRLVLPDNTARTDHTAQLFGGIRYATDSTAMAATNSNLEGTRGMASETFPFHNDSTLRGDAWNYLPETAAEVRDIQHLFQSKNWSAQLDTGYLATEEAFRAMGNNTPSPRVLHIATHGFFYPDPKTSTNDKYRMMEGHEPVFKLSDHPMIRSGLLLAGAQEAWSTGKAPENREDGILTAYEISQMNLSNTELVVLSACETGLGDIEGNEGVYGLQRAFKIAGAKYLIMSLWKVSDRSSRALMTEFYRQWLDQGLSIPDAFRKAQGMMKQKYPDAPYHWAGFVLVE